MQIHDYVPGDHHDAHRDADDPDGRPADADLFADGIDGQSMPVICVKN